MTFETKLVSSPLLRLLDDGEACSSVEDGRSVRAMSARASRGLAIQPATTHASAANAMAAATASSNTSRLSSSKAASA